MTLFSTLLALRDFEGHYYLNGDMNIDMPMKLEAAGTTFTYERGDLERLSADGPTNIELEVVVSIHK